MRWVKTSVVAIALVLVVACTNAHAQLRPPVVNVNSEFGIAAQGFMQSYSETNPTTGGTLDSEHGTVPGVQVKATTMFNTLGVENLYAGFRYQYDGGGVTYNGAFLNGMPHNGMSHYAINDIGLEFGKGFLLADNVLITPFVQGGWRGWQRSLSSIQVEDYTHYYLGAGVNGDLGITDRLVLTGRLGIAETSRRQHDFAAIGAARPATDDVQTRQHAALSSWRRRGLQILYLPASLRRRGLHALRLRGQPGQQSRLPRTHQQNQRGRFPPRYRDWVVR